MQAWLRVSHQRANLQQVRLLPSTLVGRSAECHLKIASAQVSRRHCLVSLRPDGVYVEDLGSANGTYLDGAKIPPRTPTYVRNGCRLELGPAQFIVEYKGPESSIVGADQDVIPSESASPSEGEVDQIELSHFGNSEEPQTDSEWENNDKFRIEI